MDQHDRHGAAERAGADQRVKEQRLQQRAELLGRPDALPDKGSLPLIERLKRLFRQ